MTDVTGAHVARSTEAALRYKREHFSTLGVQSHAARLGMWIFLATEILLFGGLFVAYSYYRTLYGEAWYEGSHHLSLGLGTINTLILIASSFLVASSSHLIRHGNKWLAAAALFGAVLIGFAFLGIKAVEWIHHFEEGAYPGRYYSFAAVQVAGADMFFTLYYLMTGLHALHVTIGIGVLTVLAILTVRGAFSPEYDTPVEVGGLYWHLVDIVWIFLYPLFYLV